MIKKIKELTYKSSGHSMLRAHLVLQDSPGSAYGRYLGKSCS